MRIFILFIMICTNLYSKNISWEVIENRNFVSFTNKDTSSMVIIVKDAKKANTIYFFIKKNNGSYGLIDISKIEEQNLMSFSIEKNYEKIKTIVTKWISYKKEEIITFTTIIDKEGKSFSAKQPLVIKKSGEVIWR